FSPVFSAENGNSVLTNKLVNTESPTHPHTPVIMISPNRRLGVPSYQWGSKSLHSVAAADASSDS
ncbi:hypothetical protein L195_g061042, partial [Trifolium pratense]